MRIIGIDPGIRHTGYNVLDGATSIASGTLVPPGNTRLTVVEVLNYVLPRLHKVIVDTKPEAAVVEEVAWYGSRKKITLPLSHIAGALLGFCWGLGLPTYALTPRMKNAKGIRKKKGWDEHQKDSAILAKVVADYYKALVTEDTAYLKKHATVGARCIDADFLVPCRT